MRKTLNLSINALLSTTTAPDVVLEGNRSIIVASLAKALLYKDEDQTQLLKTAGRYHPLEK
jgi:phosphosulfolactate phosphohydrolase-like enzyme